MARIPALSKGPIGFTDATGSQVFLPLSSIFFEDSVIKAEGSLYTAKKAVADPWLEHLAKIGFIVPDANPPTKTAMVITAKNAGANGNLIQIEFKNFDTLVGEF